MSATLRSALPNLAVLKYKVARLAGAPSLSIEQAARRSRVLHPGAVEIWDRPYIRESNLRRAFRSSLGELSRVIETQIMATRIEHHPVVAHELEDCVLIGHEVYCRRMYKHDLYRSVLGHRTASFAAIPSIDEAVLATTYSGTRWFGHFVHDELPIEAFAREIGEPIGHNRPDYRDEPQLRAAFLRPRAPRYDALAIGKLTIITSPNQGPAFRRQYREMRGNISGYEPSGAMIFVKRGNTGDRGRLLNEDEAGDRLAAEGFEVLDHVAMPWSEIARKAYGASVMVTFDGSHSVPWLFFMQPGATVLVLSSPGEFTGTFGRIAMSLGLKVGQYVCDRGDGRENDAHVNMDDVLRMLDETRRCEQKRIE